MQFGVDAHKSWITLRDKSLIRYGSVQCRTVGYMPISLAGICPLPCQPSADATFHEILVSCADAFPTFPDIAPYASMIPLLRPLQK